MNEKMRILNEARANPHRLAKWLYENQSPGRFGAENRIFLVLVDTDDFAESWKLKRNMDLLKPVINNYLDSFAGGNIADFRIKFNYQDRPQTFTALTDIVFVVKGR